LSQPTPAPATDEGVRQELRAITDRIGVLAGQQVNAVTSGKFGEAESVAAQMRELLERQRELCRKLLGH